MSLTTLRAQAARVQRIRELVSDALFSIALGLFIAVVILHWR